MSTIKGRSIKIDEIILCLLEDLRNLINLNQKELLSYVDKLFNSIDNGTEKKILIYIKNFINNLNSKLDKPTIEKLDLLVYLIVTFDNKYKALKDFDKSFYVLLIQAKDVSKNVLLKNYEFEGIILNGSLCSSVKSVFVKGLGNYKNFLLKMGLNYSFRSEYYVRHFSLLKNLFIIKVDRENNFVTLCDELKTYNRNKLKKIKMRFLGNV